MTTIYAFANANSLFYSLTCAAFLLCEYLVGWLKMPNIPRFPVYVGKIIAVICCVSIFLTLGILYYNNGWPTLIALNIYDVYELRRSGWLQMGKYANYLFVTASKICVPIMIALTMEKKKYFWAFAAVFAQLLFYLYSGFKSMLFASLMSLSVCVAMYVIKISTARFWCLYYTIFVVIVLLALVPEESISHLGQELYSLFERRLLIVSAVNKFAYYDYFSSHELMGLAGVFPRWLLDFSNFYSYHSIGNLIAAEYYDLPDMNANTGFLAEGYMRFWYPGIFIELVLYAFVLKFFDKFADRTSYNLFVCMFIMPVFMLRDGHLLDNIFFGMWSLVLVIAFTYTSSWKSASTIGGIKDEYQRIYDTCTKRI